MNKVAQIAGSLLERFPGAIIDVQVKGAGYDVSVISDSFSGMGYSDRNSLALVELQKIQDLDLTKVKIKCRTKRGD